MAIEKLNFDTPFGSPRPNMGMSGMPSIKLEMPPINFQNFNNVQFGLNNKPNFSNMPALGNMPIFDNNFGKFPSMNLNATPMHFNTPDFSYNSGLDTFTRSTAADTPAPAPTYTYTYTRTEKPKKHRSSSSKRSVASSGKHDSEIKYNASKGRRLAKYMADNATGFNHRCAGAVSDGLEQTGLSNGRRGNGCDYYDILSSNSNFKEVSLSSVDYKNLPEGYILVYDCGESGYSDEYGHVEVSLGNGTAASDGITHNIRKPSAIFAPV